MTISRMQQPRQLYGLGSLVKSIGKGVKKLIKSPVGKGLLLAGGFGLAGMGPFSGLAKTGLGRGLAGFFGGGMSPGAMGGKSPGIFNALKRGFQNIPGGTGTKIGIGTALATYLGSQGMEQEQIEEVQRDPNKVGRIAIAYTVWSKKKGGGKLIVKEVYKMIKKSNHLNRLVTLSPLTDMARKFHLRNGAVELQVNETTQNFEYKVIK